MVYIIYVLTIVENMNYNNQIVVIPKKHPTRPI